MKQTNVVTMLTENPNGVLGRIIALFGRHGVAIDSLSVSATAEQGVSRITVTTGCAPVSPSWPFRPGVWWISAR